MGKLSVVRIFLTKTQTAKSFLNGFYLPSSVVVIMFVVVRVVFDSPPEKITAIGITILEIITAEIQAIMIITTFPDKKPMVTDIMPKYLSIHVNLIVPTLNSNYILSVCILLNRFWN